MHKGIEVTADHQYFYTLTVTGFVSSIFSSSSSNVLEANGGSPKSASTNTKALTCELHLSKKTPNKTVMLVAIHHYREVSIKSTC